MNTTKQTSLPLLAAWEPCADLSPQQYNYSVAALPAKLIECGRSIFQRCIGDYSREGDQVRSLMAFLSPSDVTNAGVRLRRPVGHRPIIQSYKAAFVEEFVAAQTLQPARVILEYFSVIPDTGGGGTDALPPAEQSALFNVCSHHLPLSDPLRVAPFLGRRAVVWLCLPGEAVENTPDFLCVAGWTRWCALQEAFDQADFSSKTPPMEEATSDVKQEDEAMSSENPPLEYSVPVYMFDGTGLSELEIHCLSAYLNFLDSDSGNMMLTQINEPTVGASFSLDGVKSRPYGLADFLPLVDVVVDQVLATGEDGALYYNAVSQFIENTRELSFLWYWICRDVQDSPDSPDSASGMVSLLSAPVPMSGSAEQAVYLCGFLASFAYPFDYRYPEITVQMIRAIDVKRTYFWDNVLYRLIPYQALCGVSLCDVVSVMRCIEPFMMLRSRSVMQWYASLDESRTESFVAHFLRQNESVNRFVTRLCSSEKIKEMRSKNILWPYDSLATCTCFYTYHYLIELDSEFSHVDEIPEITPLKLHQGTANALLLVRAVLLYAALTFQNPTFQFEVARTKFELAPLERIIRPKIFGGAEIRRNLTSEVSPVEDGEAANNAMTDSKAPNGVLQLSYKIPKIQAEQLLEGCLGILGELVFRCVCSGLGDASIYQRPATTPVAGTAANLTEQKEDARWGYMKGLMKGGALCVQYLLTAAHVGNFGGEGAVEALLPLLVSSGPPPGGAAPAEPKRSYHCFQILNMIACRRRVYENCLFLHTTGYDPGNFSHLQILFNVLMFFHERGLSESTEQARDLLHSTNLSFLEEQHSVDVKTEVLAQAVTQFNDANWKNDATRQLVKGERRPSVPGITPTPTIGPATVTSANEAKGRIIRWFEETKCQARELMNELYQSFKSLDGSVVLACDFRDKTPDEAKAMAGALSELAADSTNLVSSLQEVPYQFGVMNCSHFRFSRVAVEAVIQELGQTMRKNLEEGMSTYLAVPDPSDVVVVSARPGVICALWQSLSHLSPFYDLLHPLACQWLSFRALFTSWIWGCIRENMMDMWRELCAEKLTSTNPDEYPALRFTLRRLPAKFDKSYLNTIIDLTPERLGMLFRGPGPLDKIGAAFYRFQCSSMADARSVLGSGSDGGVPLVKDLNQLLQCHEPCLKPLFENLWNSIDGNLQAEDVLNDARIASAGFLKKYAKYVLTGLETQDRSFDAQGRRVEPGSASDGGIGGNGMVEMEDRAGRTRKRKVVLMKEVADEATLGTSTRSGVANGGRKLEDVPKSVLAGYTTLHELKRDLKLLNRTDSSHGGFQSEQLAAMGGGQNPSVTAVSYGEWLRRLPACLTDRLRNEPMPRDPLVKELIGRFRDHLRKLRESELRQNVPEEPNDVDMSNEQHMKRRRLGVGEDEEANGAAAGSVEERSTDKSSTTLALQRTANLGGPQLPISSSSSAHSSNQPSGGPGPSSAHISLPSWLENTPLLTLWGSALRKSVNAGSLYTIPDAMNFKSESYNSTLKLSPLDWDVINSVLDFLYHKGVTSLYSSRTHQIIPIMGPSPVLGLCRRDISMRTFRAILEGDCIGYRHPTGGPANQQDQLTQSLL